MFKGGLESSLFCLMPNQGAGDKQVHDRSQDLITKNIIGVKMVMWYMCKFLYVGMSIVSRLPDGL